MQNNVLTPGEPACDVSNLDRYFIQPTLRRHSELLAGGSREAIGLMASF